MSNLSTAAFAGSVPMLALAYIGKLSWNEALFYGAGSVMTALLTLWMNWLSSKMSKPKA